MNNASSMIRIMARDILLVGTLGVMLLAIAVLIEYDIPLWLLFSPDLGEFLRQEMMEHTVLPILLVLLPMSVTSMMLMLQTFGPLHTAAKEIQNLDQRSLGYRLDPTNLPEEIHPFVAAINQLLKRVENGAIERENFSADVAHELRTPLGILLLELDNLDYPEMDRIKDQVSAMKRLVNQLMLMAQVDAAATTRQPFVSQKLSDIAVSVVSMMAPRLIDAGKSIRLEQGESTATVPMQREAVAAALRNLIENAERVTPVGGEVRVRIGEEPGLWVCDEGGGLSEAQLKRLSTRFNRADHASDTGAGLGLAIAERIMLNHGGYLATRPDAGEVGLVFFARRATDRSASNPS